MSLTSINVPKDENERKIWVKFRNCCFAASWEESQITQVRYWAVISPDPVHVAVNICLQVWHAPAPVDQEQTNAETGEVIDWVKDSFEVCETPENDFKDGPGEIAPEADVAEAKGLHDLVQVLHVLPERDHHSVATMVNWAQQRQHVAAANKQLPSQLQDMVALS